MKSNKLKREPKYIAKFKAFPYQQEAVDAVKDLEYAAIFHEQGLGKTKIAIDVLLYWLSECSMDTALIVTKKQLVANWVNEFKDHTSIKPAVLNTDKNNNYRIFCGPYRVVLTNFETLETEKQQFELYLKVRNVGIIIDESAKLKNPNSKLTKTYFELAPLFQRRIIMTGTPVANRPYDIWAQIYFLDFGESLGADFNEFKKETDLSNKLSRNTDLQEEFEDNISQIFNRISSFTVRETKNSGIITLPDKVYIQEVTEFNRMQEELYERIRTELYVRFAKGRLPEGLENKKWDRVYVTTLFTFEWENTKKALQYALSVVKPGGKVFTGGILATLRPEWIAKEFPTVINNTGLLNHEGTLGLKGEECIDTLPLDYGILDDIKDEYKYPAEDAYFTYMTRGCGMNCTFCAVKTLEPTYEPYVSISDSIKRIDKEFGPKRDLLLMDNNVLRSPKFDQIIDEIKALGFEKGATFVNPKTGKTVVRHVDFNQGLDAFLLNEHKAQRLGELAIKPARIAFDHIEDEDVYVRAITLCARAGIDHMSNYLLYNGEDFTGKGHSYHADTPEDLFYRMHLTMELGENLTEELGRKIAIFSFPMRYIPLDNDQRGFIGANWNAKYLRALQCMLIPTQGKGIQGRSFFEADFGKTAEDFVMYLAMPERLLNKRGHFVERKDEPKFEREIRYTQWSENRHLIDTWMKYYSMFEKDTVLEYIGCNRFSVETLDKIENEELKKLYFLYLTPSATIRVFSDCTEDTKRIISTFILEELPFMYSRIVETILSSKPGYKVIAGILENFGEKVCTDLLKKIDLFSGHDNDKLTMLIKANKSKRLVDFDFSLLQFIPYFHVSNLLSKQEEQIIMNSAYELKEAPIRKILLLHLDELKDVLIKTNGAQPGDTQIISVIEEQIKELYHQISIFEL